jgi:glycosyltransferase involved in cell wall biosynthesis
MKVVHVVLNYYPSVGGTQWLFQNISERLVKSYGDDVTVLTVNSYYGPEKKNYKKIELASEIYNGVNIERFDFTRWHLPLFRFVYKVLKRIAGTESEWLLKQIYGPVSKTLNKRLNTIEADIVCGSSSSYAFMQYPLHRKKVIKPFVFMGAIHFSENISSKNISSGVLKAIRQSEMYIANTYFEKSRLIELGVDDKKIVVIGCGVDEELFQQTDTSLRDKLHINNDDIVFGFVGRHEPLKNIDELIKAFDKVYAANKKTKLIIAGARSWYTEELQILVNSSGSVNNIHLLTNISEAEKISLYHSADVFVSASASESFGIVFIEAWACKKPVIGANVGAISCVIDDKKNGLLFTPHNISSLTQQMNLLATNKNLRKEMGEAGFVKMQQQYTWSVITAKYRNVYSQAIENFKL